MKKITPFFIFIFLIIMFPLSLQAKDQWKSIDPYDIFIHGEYATFHDTRGSMNFFRGYWVMKADENSLLFVIRNINLDTDEERNYLLELGTTDDGSLDILNIHGLSENEPPEFRQALADLFNFVDLNRIHSKSFEKPGTVKDKWDDFTQLFEVSPHFPLFRFRSIALESDKEKRYIMLTAGKLTNGDDSDIAAFMGIQPLQNIEFLDPPKLILEEDKPLSKKLHNYTVNLDKRWGYNDSLGSPGYWLSERSKRDAQLCIERLPWDFLKKSEINDIPTFIKLMLYRGPESTIIMDSLKIEKKKNYYELSYHVFDQENRRSRLYFKLWTEDNCLYAINFSSYLETYNSNKEYFDKIIESIQKE